MNANKITIAVLITAWGWAGVALAAKPLLDRPSPPPYCADGLCYPKVDTWGWYATRWRRWPTVVEPPVPGVTPPPPVSPDIPPYERPTPEEEDRRAPLPTRPPAAETPAVPQPGAPTEAPAPAPAAPGAPAAPLEERPRTTPILPPSTPSARPPALPFEGPSGVPQESVPVLPFETPPPPSLPFGEPTGDVDPPPTPRFLSPQNAKGAVGSNSTKPVKTPAASGSRGGGRAAVDSDPPPPLPVKLASWTN